MRRLSSGRGRGRREEKRCVRQGRAKERKRRKEMKGRKGEERSVRLGEEKEEEKKKMKRRKEKGSVRSASRLPGKKRASENLDKRPMRSKQKRK